MKISDLPQALAELERASRLRVPDDGILRREMEQVFGSDFIDAASNDYLGLALTLESSVCVSRETEGDGSEPEQVKLSLKADAKSLTSAQSPGFKINSEEQGGTMGGETASSSDLGGSSLESLKGSEPSLSESPTSHSLSPVSRGTVPESGLSGSLGVKSLREETRGNHEEASPALKFTGTLPSDLGGSSLESLKGSEPSLSESPTFHFSSRSLSPVSRGTVSESGLPGSSGAESLGDETCGLLGEAGPSLEPFGTPSNSQGLGRGQPGQDAETPPSQGLSPIESSPPRVSRGIRSEARQHGYQGEPSGKDKESDSMRGLGTSPTNAVVGIAQTSASNHETKRSAFPPVEENRVSFSQDSPPLVSRETEVQGICDQAALLTSFSSTNLSQQPAEDGAAHESLASSTCSYSCGEPINSPRTDITVGAGSSRLIFGTSPQHVLLEQELATWVGLPASLLFASGYAANVGALSALLSPEDAVFSDSLNHASLIDGIRLSRARPQVYSHLNLEELEAGLARSSKAPARWVICEAYYSMDGDAPHLRSLRELCDKYDAHLYVDEAHSLGTFGPRGAGLCALHGILPDVMMAAFGKAVGSQGACVAGSQALRTWLWNRARSFVFSTAPSPLLVAATRRQFERTQAADVERVRLEAICSEVRRLLLAAGMPLVTGSFGPVVGLLMGEEERALRLADRLRAAGILAQAVRPPTVPPGASRVRLVLRASLSDKQMQRLVEVVAREVAE